MLFLRFTFLFFLLITLHSYGEVDAATCEFSSTIMNKHQAIIDEVVENPVTTTLDAPVFPSDFEDGFYPYPQPIPRRARHVRAAYHDNSLLMTGGRGLKWNRNYYKQKVHSRPVYDEQGVPVGTMPYDYEFPEYVPVIPLQPIDLDRAGINYHYLGENPSSLLIVITDDRPRPHYGISGHQMQMQIDRVNSIIWREMSSQKFINITDIVLTNKADVIHKVVTVPERGDVDSLIFLACREDDRSGWYLSYTKDAGKTFQMYNIPAHYITRFDFLFPELKVSPSSIEHVIVSEMIVTKDGGKNWVEIIDKEYFPSYQGKTHKTMWVNTTMILISTKVFEHNKEVISLHRCDISAQKPKCRMLLYHIKNFVVKGNVIVASIYHESDQIANRSLYTTTDLGDVWNRAQIPVFQQHHRPYVYLMSETLSFLTLLNEEEGCYDMFVSDSVHVAYSLSMKCLYDENKHIGRLYGIERLGDLSNVFVVNKFSNVTNGLTTYITRNNGGSWHMAKINGSYCEDCIFSSSDDEFALDYSEPNYLDNTKGSYFHIGTRLSSPFVPGFALSNFRYNTQQQPDDFRSRSVTTITVDGGKSFFEIPPASKYTFLCSGDVLVIYDSEYSTQLSFDRGHCWYNYTLGDHSRSHRILLLTNSLDHQHDTLELLVFSITYPFDFHTFIPVPAQLTVESFVFDVSRLLEEVPICKDDNTHVESEDVCVLGQKYHYKRPKQGTETCKLHQNNVEPDSVSCECTYEDFECDFGFRAKSPDDTNNSNDETLICEVLNEEELDQVSICYHQLYNEHEKYFNTTGYRKVVGTKCRESEVERKINSAKSHSFKVLCEADDESLLEITQTQTGKKPKVSESSVGSIFLTILMLTLVACVICGVIYLVKVKNIKPSFDMSFLHNIRSTVTTAAPFNFSRFEDES